MLKKDELKQLTTIIDEVLKKKLETAFEPIKSDIRILKIDVGTLKADMQELKLKVSKIEKQTADLPQLRKRVSKIENHLGIENTT